VHNTRYSAEGQVHSVSVEVGGRFGTVDVCQRELRDLKKAKGTKRKRLQVDFISGISESVAVGRIKENSTVKQTSVEAKRRHFQAIAATVADQQDGDSVGLEAVAIAVGAVGAVVAAASQVIPQQQPMILTGAVAEEPVHVAPAAAISRGQEWRRKKREELTDLVTGPFSLGGDLCVECDTAYNVTGDTAFVHFNDVYDFKIGEPCTYTLHRSHLYTHAVGKWSWNNAAKIWSMKREIIASQCGYNGDERAPIRQLAQACKMNGFVKLELSKP
jgi:hypothetical protein